MRKIRYFLALWAAKASIVALRLFKKTASTFPGAVALKICPDFIRLSPKTSKTICVTGTNGKTTVTNMIASSLEKLGCKVSTNATGANIATGASTILINSVNLLGKLQVDYQVFEVDERYSRLILPNINPDYLVVTNIFRDSLKRNAHPDYIFSVINSYTPQKTHVILNADDLCSSMLLPDNTRTYFGIDRQESDVTEPYNLIADYSICPKCFIPLKFHYLRYHTIGKAYCDQCGFSSADAQYLATNIRQKENLLDIRINDETITFPLISPILFNVYNELAVVTLLHEFGIETDKIQMVFSDMGVVSSRLQEIPAGDAVVVRAMSKGQSAVSTCRTLDFVSKEPGNKTVVLVIDDWYERKDSSEFIGWIYDADFEYLAKDDVCQVIALGPRCADYRVRLLMAGIDPDRIVCGEEEFSTIESIQIEDVERIYVLYDTSTYDLACRVSDRIIEMFRAKKEAN